LVLVLGMRTTQGIMVTVVLTLIMGIFSGWGVAQDKTPASAQSEIRVWTDLTGRKISAALVGFKDKDTLILRLGDGRKLPFPVSKLSAGDEAFARKAYGKHMKGDGGQNVPTAASSFTIDKPFVNSLGMRFVPVPITGGPTDGKEVLFCSWETRLSDYEAFTRKEQKDNPEIAMRETSFSQKRDQPAVAMNWKGAEAFCVWLTGKEQKTGKITQTQQYRLPTDHEWSCAVGIGGQEDASASKFSKSGKIAGVYPWGNAFPPTDEVVNIYGEEVKKNPYEANRVPISGYDDDFDRTSSVGSFKPNKFGLYDMGGNVMEWCQDWFDQSVKFRAWRGGGWHSYEKDLLLSSYRQGALETYTTSFLGFRVVLVSK